MHLLTYLSTYLPNTMHSMWYAYALSIMIAVDYDKCECEI